MNQREIDAANIRAQAAGQHAPTLKQIRTGEFGDNRSALVRRGDELAAKNPRAAINPFSALLAVNLAKQTSANFTSPVLAQEGEQLKAREAEFNSRRDKLASVPRPEAPSVDPLRSAADVLRNAPRQIGEGNWRQAAADALERKADTRDLQQQQADAEQARQNDPFLKNTILRATAELRFRELRGDYTQPEVNEAREILEQVRAGTISPEEYWAVHEPAATQKMGALMDQHKAERDRRQADVDAYEEQVKEGLVAPPVPAPEA